MPALEPDAALGPPLRRGPISISHKLGLAFLSIGAAVLLIIGQTYRTFDALGNDNELKEVSHALESSAFQIQLLTLRHLHGEDLEREIRRERSVFRGRLRDLLGDDGDDGLTAAERRTLLETWEAYQDTGTAVLASHAALRASADDARRRFDPWLASIAEVEAKLDGRDGGNERTLHLLADLRSATAVVRIALLKLISAPPGEHQQQALDGLRVGSESCVAALGRLGADARFGGPSEERAALGVAGLDAAWAALGARLDEVIDRKAALLARVHPSERPNLTETFEALTSAQAIASSRYDARAAARRDQLTATLVASLLIVALVVTTTMVGVRRSVITPIRRLTRGTVQLTSGDLDTRIDVRSRDEVGQLAASFNAMAESLSSSRRQLRTWARTLEQQVRERTEDLRGANERLIQEIRERERVEGELRLAQKLESVGQLAAGIAHEINTPIQYINDNTKFLRDAFCDTTPVLLGARRLAERVRDALATPEDAEALLRHVEAADLDFLLEETPTSLQQTLDGIERVAKIVRAMKEFSHPGVEEMTLVDLNHAIEGTVTVASNEWKYVAQVELDLSPDLPPVLCLPGEVNQVLLNMIVNAAHAIGDVASTADGERGTIRISTAADGEVAVIRISDTGAGIPEEIRDRIFDQFFTTKEVGRGTGQGLSIAHGVVVGKHGGTIHLESEVGKGTTFTIRLPMEGAGAGVPAAR